MDAKNLSCKEFLDTFKISSKQNWDRGHYIVKDNEPLYESKISEEDIVSFYMSQERRRGIGKVEVPLSELESILSVFEEIIENNFSRKDIRDKERYVPVSEIVEKTWKMTYPKVKQTDIKTGRDTWALDYSRPKDYLVFQTGLNKGNKPVSVHKDAFVKITSILKEWLGAHRGASYTELAKEYSEDE